MIPEIFCWDKVMFVALIMPNTWPGTVMLAMPTRSRATKPDATVPSPYDVDQVVALLLTLSKVDEYVLAT
jgi:hypothetical protein